MDSSGFVFKSFFRPHWSAISWIICLAAAFGSPTADARNSQDVPAMLVYHESAGAPAHAVLVDKASQELLLYEAAESWRLLKRMRCSTGENHGPKRNSGDKKTPEGVYFFTGEHESRDLAPIYGSRAFPIDYPNYMDRMRGLDGSAIWLHGANKPLKDRDSNGCIVLNNSDIDELRPFLEMKRTPMLIAEKITHRGPAPNRELGRRILAFLDEWRRALENGAHHDYLKFYASAYMPEMGWWNEWNRARTALRDMGQSVGVRLSRKAVYAHEDMYVALFDQEVTIDGHGAPAGTRQLFFREEDGGFRVIGDQHRPFETAAIRAGAALPAAAGKLLALHDGEHAIRRMIEEWLDAWSSRDIRRYSVCYADDFFSRGMDRKAWIQYKERLNTRYSFIRVKQEDLRIGRGGDRREVSFIQTYESDHFKTRGRKHLVLKKQEGNWKIQRETWEKIGGAAGDSSRQRVRP